MSKLWVDDAVLMKTSERTAEYVLSLMPEEEDVEEKYKKGYESVIDRMEWCLDQVAAKHSESPDKRYANVEWNRPMVRFWSEYIPEEAPDERNKEFHDFIYSQVMELDLVLWNGKKNKDGVFIYDTGEYRYMDMLEICEIDD